MNFNQLGLSTEILKSLTDEGYQTPTAIQEKAIPAILDRQDVMAAAQTGTGKTAGFTLPILDLLSQGEKAKPGFVRTLILAPTRELAAQVLESVQTYGKYLSITSTSVFGGVKINPQIARLKKGVDILVATPGRLLDLIQQRAVQLSQLEILVLDEADRMLDMGFIHDIKKIIALLPKKRQNLMFSATFSAEIRTLAKSLMQSAVEITATPPNSTVKAVKQIVHPVDKKQKNALLSHLIWENKWEQVLVFARTKHGANKLAEFLCQDGMDAVAIHGNKSQGARTRALAAFKNGEARVLVATDIAARGLDIELLPHVVNFDLPQVPEDYIHRIGRTGRAGATGEAISLVSADEFRILIEIERLIKQKLPQEIIEGFAPDHSLPKARSEKTFEPRRNQSPRQENRRSERRFEKSDRPKRENTFNKFSDRKKPTRFSDDSPRKQKTDRFERTTKKEWAPEERRSEKRSFTKMSDGSSRPARKSREDNQANRFSKNEKPWAPKKDRLDKPWSPKKDRDDRDNRSARFDRSEKRDFKSRDDEAPRKFKDAKKKPWSPRRDDASKTSFSKKPLSKSGERRGKSSFSTSQKPKSRTARPSGANRNPHRRDR